MKKNYNQSNCPERRESNSSPLALQADLVFVTEAAKCRQYRTLIITLPSFCFLVSTSLAQLTLKINEILHNIHGYLTSDNWERNRDVSHSQFFPSWRKVNCFVYIIQALSCWGTVQFSFLAAILTLFFAFNTQLMKLTHIFLHRGRKLHFNSKHELWPPKFRAGH